MLYLVYSKVMWNVYVKWNVYSVKKVYYNRGDSLGHETSAIPSLNPSLPLICPSLPASDILPEKFVLMTIEVLQRFVAQYIVHVSKLCRQQI